MKKIVVIALAAGIVGLVIGSGLMYFAFHEPEPEVPQLKVVAELAKTQYQVGEEISVRPYLINMGRRPIDVVAHGNLLFMRVYDAENTQVLQHLALRHDILRKHSLRPGVRYNEEDIFPYFLETYTFALEQPGRYKIVVWAELSLDKNYDYPLHIYAEPIWIEVKS